MDLLKDDSLCAWNYDFSNENEKSPSKRTNNKKYDVLKPNVVGLQVRKSHFYVNSRYRNPKHSKDKPPTDEGRSFVHYTDATQYVEEYRRSKLERLKKEYEVLIDGAGGGGDTNITFFGGGYDVERQKTPPVVRYQAYGTMQGNAGGASAGFHLDTWNNNSRGSLKEEKKRELLSYVKVRGGGRCLDQHESDTHPPNFKPIPVASCKPINICNLFPYDHSSTHPEVGGGGKSAGPSSSTKSRDVARKQQQHQHGVKSPVKMNDDVKKIYRHSRHSVVSSRKENEYCHIIKKVFDHTSKLTTSTTSRSKKSDPAETKFNYVLTPS